MKSLVTEGNIDDFSTSVGIYSPFVFRPHQTSASKRDAVASSPPVSANNPAAINPAWPRSNREAASPNTCAPPRAAPRYRNPRQKVRRSTAAPPWAQQQPSLSSDPTTATPPRVHHASSPPVAVSIVTSPDPTATSPPLPLVIGFSSEEPTTTEKLTTASKPPPPAAQTNPPRSSSPTISSGFSSSSQSPNDSPRQRSRLGKGKSVLPPSSKLGGFATFKSKVQQTRYNELCRYPIIPGKCVDYDALNALNIRDEFVALVDGIGWSGYFHVKLPAFIELTREFYTTFKFNKTKDLTLTSPVVVKFRLMGKEFSYSIIQFNVALGFVDNDYVQADAYSNSCCDYLRDFCPYQIWKTISTDTTCYHPSQSKSSYLREPVLKYIQRFLAYNYSGRKDSSGTFTKAEFYFIWCMQNKIKANLGIWLAIQFQSASNKKRLILGSYITQLAVSLKLLNLSNTNMHIACHMEPLDIDCLHRMGIVTLKHGRPTFTSPGPTVQPKKRKRRDMEEPSRDTTSSTPETSNMHSFSRHFEDRLNRIESKLDRILAHFHIPPD
ncbi:hypothetical protein BUALT_Bualt01G0212800 [Buddleja alternifolia]|uniref:Arabidopsis retrotransposon Orf1 C-terminal domain-containing protein n=1 Tax=Buddleja alternifolia TaxID=168488 RepID=A0AAV6YAJ5_9LAMI|nr:hypothetical protein BUALT_Bualt01G0212800 [Buddleja alternifolia]